MRLDLCWRVTPGGKARKLMDTLWSPWRFRYVSEGAKDAACPFCEMAASSPAKDRELLILLRAAHNFVFLNLYPYTAGHILVAPYRHAADLGGVDEIALHELISLARQAEAALRSAYHCEGLNVGINVGRCAGAGVANHLHLHCVPRWNGDANFMTVTGETRVLPEELSATYNKLSPYFQQAK